MIRTEQKKKRWHRVNMLAGCKPPDTHRKYTRVGRNENNRSMADLALSRARLTLSHPCEGIVKNKSIT